MYTGWYIAQDVHRVVYTQHGTSGAYPAWYRWCIPGMVGYTTGCTSGVYHGVYLRFIPLFNTFRRFMGSGRLLSHLILTVIPGYSWCFLSKPHVNPLLNPVQEAMLHKTSTFPVLYFILRFYTPRPIPPGLRPVSVRFERE